MDKRKCLNCDSEVTGHPLKKYCDDTCQKMHWNRNNRKYVRTEFLTWDKSEEDAEQIPMFTPRTPKQCTCHQWQTCMICRNAEKRRAHKAGEVPVFRRNVIENITRIAAGD
jgi:hypothetical protein